MPACRKQSSWLLKAVPKEGAAQNRAARGHRQAGQVGALLSLFPLKGSNSPLQSVADELLTSDNLNERGTFKNVDSKAQPQPTSLQSPGVRLKNGHSAGCRGKAGMNA